MKVFRPFFVSIVFVLAVVLLMTQISWKSVNGEENRRIISGDGVGYYQYLVSLFIQNDIQHQELKGAFMKPVNNRVVNKCFVGTALCMSPFFGLGVMHTKLADQELNAYNLILQRWINVGGIFYLLLGLFFISRWLSSFELNVWARYSAIICLFFGTNLLLYSILSPSMSHVYSFFSVSGFLYAGRNFFLKTSVRWGYLAAFFFGLIIIIRPVNGIVLLLLPFLSGGIRPLFQRFQHTPIRHYFIAATIFFTVLSIQSWMWYLQTGHWFVWSYGDEGFYFNRPQLYEVLFGFRKGWFIYTPMAFLGMTGLFFQYKRNKETFFFLVLFLKVLLYITASWWNWFYGSSFGQRPLVDFYSLIALLLALSFQQLKKRWSRIIMGSIAVLFMALNLIQTYQYKENLISSWDMTFKKYTATFLVTEVGAVKIGGNHDLLPYRSNLTIRVDTTLDFTSSASIQTTIDSLTGQRVADFSNREYNVGLNLKLGQEVKDNKGNYLELELQRMEKSLFSSENAKVIVLLKDSLEKEYYSYWFIMNEVPVDQYNKWEKYQYQVLLPPTKTKEDELIVFIRNEDKTSFYVNDFRVKLSGIE